MRKLTHTQERLIEKSLKIISEHGIEKLTMKNLANELNFTDAAIYKHFSGKDKILENIIYYFENIINQELAVIFKYPNNSIEFLKNLYIKRCDLMTSHHELVTMLVSYDLFKSRPKLDELMSAVHASYHQTIMEVINEGQSKGVITKKLNPDSIYTILEGAYFVLISSWKKTDMRFDLVDKAMDLWEDLESILEVKN